MQVSTPLSPSFVSFCQIEGKQSSWEQFCEQTLKFNPQCYLVKANGTVIESKKSLSCCQTIKNLALILFATLLVLPLVCMIATKWATRKYLALRLEAKALEIESANKRAFEVARNRTQEDEKAAAARTAADDQARRKRAEEDEKVTAARTAADDQARKKRAEENQAAAAVRSALDDAATQRRTEIELKAKELLSTAVQQAHQVLNGESYGAWYKAPWEVISKGTGTANCWTLKRHTGFGQTPYPGLMGDLVKIALQDHSVVHIDRNLLTNDALNIFLKQPNNQESEKKYAVSSSTSTIIGLEEEQTASSHTDLDLSDWSPTVVKHYLHLISGKDTLENVSVEELVELYRLANYLCDNKVERVVLEATQALMLFDRSFHIQLLIAYLESQPASLNLLPQLVWGLSSRWGYDPNRAYEGIDTICCLTFNRDDLTTNAKFFALLRLRQEQLLKTNQRDLCLEFLLYTCYYFKIGCEIDVQLALKIRKEICTDTPEEMLKTKGLSSWDYFFIALSLTSSQRELGLSFLRQCLDIPQAQYYLAFLDKNSPEAERLQFIQTAADQGIDHALLALSHLYERGEYGLLPQVDKALIFNQLAQTKRISAAYSAYAGFLDIVTRNNSARSDALRKTAASLDADADAKKNPDILISQGKHYCLFASPKDYRRSIAIFHRAYRLGNSEAGLWLGIHFAEGWTKDADGIAMDERATEDQKTWYGKELLREAHARGHPNLTESRTRNLFLEMARRS